MFDFDAYVDARFHQHKLLMVVRVSLVKIRLNNVVFAKLTRVFLEILFSWFVQGVAVITKCDSEQQLTVG